MCRGRLIGRRPARLMAFQDGAALHAISKNHLMKVAHQIGLSGMVETIRSRNGGLRLNQATEQINIGALVRNTKSDFYRAVCFELGNAACMYVLACVLKGALPAATAAYRGMFDGVTLADLMKP
jgi:Rrf2 family nitric oxide-sensitive transcriptional repressor